MSARRAASPPKQGRSTTPPASEPRRRRGLSLAWRVALTVGILGVILWQLDLARSQALLRQLSVWWLIPILLVHVADRWLMAWKWRFLVDAAGNRLDMLRAFRLYYIASFQGFLVPGGIGADLIRYLRLRNSEIPRERVAASLVVERVLGMAATGLAAVLSFFLYLWLVGGATPGWMAPTLVVVALAVGGGLLVVLDDPSRRRVGRLPGVRALLPRLEASPWWQAVAAYKDRRRILLRFLGWSFAEQYMYVLAVWFAARSLGIPLGILGCMAAVPITALLQRLPLTIMGLGIREGALVFLLGLLGISYSEAVLVSLLQFAVLVVALLPGGAWDLVAERRRRA